MSLIQPVGSITGRLTMALGASMLAPAGLDWIEERGDWSGIVLAAFLTIAAGAIMSVLFYRKEAIGLTRRQAFLLTVLVWLILPFFGALPLMFGPPYANFTDAYFEAMSGLTTTGSTVFIDLDDSPGGMLLWRSMLQWFGGVGIVIVAMVFLPVMKIGGMQFFQSEAFDVGTGLFPRANELAVQLAWIYIGLTVACALSYSAVGMKPFDAICHAMTTVSTGGLGTKDNGFEEFSTAAHYVAIVFMWLAAWPFLRFIQFLRGKTDAVWQDPQVRAFLLIIFSVSAAMVAWLVAEDHHPFWNALKEALFNVTSVMTGTGYASDNYNAWGGLPVALFFTIGLIGGCTGSTSCSAKLFRYQILLAALRIQLRRIHSPHGVFPLRYDHRPVDAEVLSSVMGFFFFFSVSLALWAVLLSLTGEDAITSISGAAAALANIGPGLGEKIGPSGNYKELTDLGKWIFSAGMLLGRLEFVSVLVLVTPAFWNR